MACTLAPVESEAKNEVHVTVLIADDSTLIRSNLRKLIAQSRSDIILRESDDVECTIRELGSGDIDVLILDLEFPDGSGFDVLRQLGKEGGNGEETRQNSDRPFVIVLTNHAREKLKNKSLKMGANLFFDKTDEYERVVEAISRL